MIFVTTIRWKHWTSHLNISRINVLRAMMIFDKRNYDIGENRKKIVSSGRIDFIRRFYLVSRSVRGMVSIDAAETWLADTPAVAHKSVHLFYAAKRAFFCHLRWESVFLRRGEWRRGGFCERVVDEGIGTCKLRRAARIRLRAMAAPYAATRARGWGTLFCQELKSERAIKRKIAGFPGNN